MSDVLKKELQERANAAESNARRNRIQNALRMISLLAMAAFVYVYHSMLFDAIQPFFNRLYSLVK